MKINFNSLKPVYVQIAEAVEDEIINGSLKEGSAAYSQLVLSRELGVNPATAAKGISKLVAKGILEKQRGSSMVVASGAFARLVNERRSGKLKELVENLVSEAEKLSLTEDDVMHEIKKHYENRGGE